MPLIAFTGKDAEAGSAIEGAMLQLNNFTADFSLEIDPATIKPHLWKFNRGPKEVYYVAMITLAAPAPTELDAAEERARELTPAEIDARLREGARLIEGGSKDRQNRG